MGRKKETKSLSKSVQTEVTVVLDYPSHFEGVLYEKGKHEVDPDTAKRLKEINKVLRKEENR